MISKTHALVMEEWYIINLITPTLILKIISSRVSKKVISIKDRRMDTADLFQR